MENDKAAPEKTARSSHLILVRAPICAVKERQVRVRPFHVPVDLFPQFRVLEEPVPYTGLAAG